MLEGSMDGVIYYLRPQWSKLLEPQVSTALTTICSLALLRLYTVMFVSM